MDKYWADFEVGHARTIIETNGRMQERWADPAFVDKWYAAWKGKILAKTLMVDGVPVACIGLALQEWNKAEAWALFSASFKEHILTIYRMVVAGIDYALKNYGIVRIQTTIDPNWPGTVRWIESLGFEYEGTLKKFGPYHEDYLMYGITCDDPQQQHGKGALVNGS